MRLVGFISCVSLKRKEPCMAKDMYVSPLFKMSRRIVERRTSRWFILSAKHGVLDPNQLIEPYDVTLTRMPKKAREDWATKVRKQIKQVAGDDDIVVLAGDYYIAPFKGITNKVLNPLDKLEIGERLQWLKQMGG